MDAELRMVVGELRNGHAVDATGLKADHIKGWLTNIIREEREDGGVEELGDQWQSCVSLLQVVWTIGSVPTQMSWMLVVLLPKGGGDYCCIGLLNPIWKVVEKVMVFWFTSLKLHNCLHHELPQWGTGTAIMEAKLQQQHAWAEQEPLYQIYLDVKKVYDALDQGRCLEILAGYWVGPNLFCLQEQFWNYAKMFCHTGGNYGKPFGAYRGVTQWGPLSSLMFNVCVDCVIWEWLHQVMGDKVTWEGVEDAVCNHCIVFL
jgi:hypothetical protein